MKKKSKSLDLHKIQELLIYISCVTGKSLRESCDIAIVGIKILKESKDKKMDYHFQYVDNKK